MWRKTAKNNVGHKGPLREVKLRKVKKKNRKKKWFQFQQYEIN